MPCKRNRPTKCTPTSRRMLEGLTIRDLSDATPDYLPSSQTPHPIPISGQYANDPNDCNPGVSCRKCNHQKSNERLSLTSNPQTPDSQTPDPQTPDPQTPSQSETCVATCREVSAMYDDIRQCRDTIGALAKEAQQLITTASGILDGCGCDKSFKAKQENKVEYNGSKRTSIKNSYGQQVCREACNERLIPCASCENAAKVRRNTTPYGNVVMSKKYNNTNTYARRNSYKDIQQKQSTYKRKSSVQIIPSNPKIRQRSRASLKEEKQPEIKNCCQKICGDDCACDGGETATKELTKLNGGNKSESKVNVNNCGCKTGTTCKDKLSKTICGNPNSCVCVAPNEDNKEIKVENKTSDIKNGRQEKNGEVVTDKNTCCDCATRKAAENTPSNGVTKKQTTSYKIPNKKNMLQKKNGREKRASKIEKNVCPDKENCCKKVCGVSTTNLLTAKDKVEDEAKEEIKKPNIPVCSIDVDDCACVREMKKRSKKLGRFAKIWRIIREGEIKCDCANTAYGCGCADGKCNVGVDDCACFREMKKRSKKLGRCARMWRIIREKEIKCDCANTAYGCGCVDGKCNRTSLTKTSSNICCLKKIRDKVCGKTVICNCLSKKVDDCRCDEPMEEETGFFKRVRSVCSLDTIRNKVCGKTVTCNCSSKKVDDCKCDEAMYEQPGLLERARSVCSLDKIRNKVCGKNTNCQCPSQNVDDCECDDEENQNSFVKCATGSLTKVKNKVCGKNINCECKPKADDCGCYDIETQSCLTKVKKKVCGEVICECPPETIEKMTNTKDTSIVSDDAPTAVTNFIFNNAKNKRRKKIKLDSKVGPSDFLPTDEKSCNCHFPPAYSQYFECTGQIGGNCQCDTND